MLKFLFDLICKFLMLEHILVAEHQRVLLFKKGRFVALLLPGSYYFWNVSGHIAYEVFDIITLEFTSKYADTLLKQHPKVVEQYFFVADVADNQVAIMSVDGKLHTVLPPGTRQFFWKELHDISMELVNIAEDYEIPSDKISPLTRIRTQHILIHVVPEGYLGVLFVDGQLQKTLTPGMYGFWKAGRDIRCDSIDTRLQQLDVQGQEILTKDRVSLRVNLTCWFVIADPVKAITSVSQIRRSSL